MRWCWLSSHSIPLLLLLISSPAASVALSRKHYFGSEFISFLAVAARAASAPDGTFSDNSRLTCLRCLNNLLCLRTLQVEVALQTQEFLAPLAPSGASAHQGVLSEWILLLRNIAAVVYSCRLSGCEAHAQYIAGLVLPFLRASSASCGETAWNAALALGTCLHTCKNSSKTVDASPVLVTDSKAALLHVKAAFAANDPVHLIALEALELLQ